MKVAYVIPSVAGAGGAERSLAAMAPYLARHVDLHVITFSGRPGLEAELEAAGAHTVALAPGHRVEVLRALRDVVGDLGPDLVHTTLIDADVVGRLAAVSRRIPVTSSLVNVNHGRDHLRLPSGSPTKRAAAWAADAATARLVVRFHALTRYVAETMGRRLGIARSRIDVIPRGRDPVALGSRSPQRRRAARAALGVGHEPLVVAAARHEHQKGLDVLVRAVPVVLANHPGARFLIGGRDGASSEHLRHLLAETPGADRVRLIGQRDDVPELMCAADVWCVPSRWEGLGSILIEAMALEVPVVASDLAPIREIAGQPPVFSLVPPDQPDALATAISDLLDDPAAARTGAGRRRFVERYTAERVSLDLVGFFDRALSSSRYHRGTL